MISGIWRKTADRREQNIVQRKPPEIRFPGVLTCPLRPLCNNKSGGLCQKRGIIAAEILMLRHLMVDGIEFLIIPVIVMDHSCLGIIRNQDTGNTAEVLIHMYMSCDPARCFSSIKAST
jgi:hypothetical protein